MTAGGLRRRRSPPAFSWVHTQSECRIGQRISPDGRHGVDYAKRSWADPRAGETTPVKRVCMLIPSFHPLIGGAETQVRGLSAALLERGWMVSVVTRRDVGTREGPPLSRFEEVDGIPVIRIRSAGPGKLASLRYLVGGLWALGRMGRGSIYHAHDFGTPGLMAALASRLLGGRSVVKLRTGASVYRSRFGSGLRRRLFLRLLALHNRVVVVNHEVEELLHSMGLPPDRVVRIPNAIDGNIFRGASPRSRLEARSRLGLPKDLKIVLYVGRLMHVKGVDILLRAWALLPEALRKGALLVIVGDGPERERLERMVYNRAIHHEVRFTGSRTDAADFYQAADIFVLPSRTEGLSNALLEAMASELPVVATAAGGTPDVVEDGHSGILVPGESEEGLAKGLTSMLSDPAQWEGMGVRGRARALEHAGYAVVLERLQSLYTDVESELQAGDPPG